METPFGTLPEEHVGRLSMAEIHEVLTARTVSRRSVLRAGVLAAGAVIAGPTLWRRPGYAAVPPGGRHLAFGADPAREMTVSWATAEPVEGAVVDIGPDTSYGATLPAETRAVAGTPTLYHHAVVSGLTPATTYHYRVRHDGGESADATFRTAPAEPQPFTFTSFGDQGVSDDAASTTGLVASIDPAFHFLVGDLCYAFRTGTGNPLNPVPPIDVLVPILTDQSVWDAWLAQVTAHASRAPWMTAVGNHEMEYGYGPLGYDSYYGRFTMPATGPPEAPAAYSFRYGHAGFVALDSNDVSWELSANRDYTGGAQDAWLRGTLAEMRADPTLDFIVVGYHFCSYCTNAVHGSDAGPRERWGSVFDEHSIDLVINGHNHCYERSHPIRAGAHTREAPSGATIEPATDGTTYVTAGGGGQLGYQLSLYPLSTVSVAPGVRVLEAAPWSAIRYFDLSLIAVDVSPRDSAGIAEMTVRALRPDGTEIERVRLRRAASAA